MRITGILGFILLSTGMALAIDRLEVPSVTLVASYNGPAKLTVNAKTYSVPASDVAALRNKFSALRVERMRQEYSTLQDLESQATRSGNDSTTTERIVDRERNSVIDKERQIKSLEKKQEEIQQDIKDYLDRNIGSPDNLTSQLKTVVSSLASERKELDRLRVKLAEVEKHKRSVETKENSSVTEAAKLRKDLTERVKELNVALKPYVG
jgi:chromosome segregation ATPase